MDTQGAITRLLRRLGAGERGADAELLPLVYDELRALAARQLAHERAGHTLTPTALVHEAWMRLADDGSLAPADRRQFYAIAARRMRQVLVDHARRRDAAKRGGVERERITLSVLADGDGSRVVDALALDDAMEKLERLDGRKARVVELRFFAGLEMTEIAELLEISRATAQRDWEVARAFLYRELA